MAKKVLSSHLVQLDGTLYVMLHNDLKNPINQFDFDEKRYIAVDP